MLNRMHNAELKQIVGVVYFSPSVSRESLAQILRFVRENAIGHYRWGNMYQYWMIEFDEVDDLTATRGRFSRLIDGYKDLSDCPDLIDY